ncbi:MAG: PTS sugar transporter subunit IIA [Chthoniobacterales bacterium]
MNRGLALLETSRVRLDLAGASREAAVEEALGLLRDDPRIGSWEEFRRAVGEKQVVDLDGCAGGVILAHGRSSAVKNLALAAARWSGPEGDACLIFVFAIPSAMAEEYLRKVGAMARTCRDPQRLAELRAAPTAEEFAAKLEEWLG